MSLGAPGFFCCEGWVKLGDSSREIEINNLLCQTNQILSLVGINANAKTSRGIARTQGHWRESEWGRKRKKEQGRLLFESYR